MEEKDIVSAARRVFEVEGRGLKEISDKVDGAFARAVEMMLSTTGKIVVIGMGKSGLICQKIAATLASTGTPALFLHPAEGVHGDLGVLMKNDLVIAVSNSGETEEVLSVMPYIKRLGISLVAMTGGVNSTLAGYADVTLDVGVSEEACPHGLAPTTSTTATLAMGDALAVALLEGRGFRAEDFADLHPAGNLGRRLLSVSEIMHSGDEVPRVESGSLMKGALLEMTRKRLGLTGVFDKNGALIGVMTDGDLRRALDSSENMLEESVDTFMGHNPKLIGEDELAESALRVMEEHSITSLFVENSEGECVGLIHLHDLIKAGVL